VFEAPVLGAVEQSVQSGRFVRSEHELFQNAESDLVAARGAHDVLYVDVGVLEGIGRIPVN
jgi:hypothetical protein